MVGTILIVLGEGFDDMAYLTTQVILEEAGNDVITSSPSGGAVKGETSSAMSVEFNDALNQNVDYSALVIAGGTGLGSLPDLKDQVKQFHASGKILVAFGSSIEIIKQAGVGSVFSSDSNPVSDKNIFTLFDTENCEAFVENLALKLH